MPNFKKSILVSVGAGILTIWVLLGYSQLLIEYPYLYCDDACRFRMCLWGRQLPFPSWRRVNPDIITDCFQPGSRDIQVHRRTHQPFSTTLGTP